MPSPRPRRRVAELADGREIVYFDDPSRGEQPAPPADRRDLPPVPPPAELRHDPLVAEWVIIAAHRQTRTFLPPTRDCPLCPSRGEAMTEVPAADYDVVVFENRFPSLPADADGADGTGAPTGRCDVICYSSDHDASFATLSDERLSTIAQAWAERTATLNADPGVAYVFPFENRGEQIGVTLHHPHGQIYAYPFIPPRAERMLAAATAHRESTGRCLGCDVLADEVADGTRIVAGVDAAVAYVPRAARWPYEIHVVPRRHVPDLAALSDDERDALVLLQADVVHRLDAFFGAAVPYIAGWVQAPAREARDVMHLRLQIVSPQRDVGKLKYLAGSEAAMGAFINDVRPEDAAQRLRDAPGRRGR
jgi:UDPglucose--hexose-1-phosphate uridylyltransferase